MKTLIIGDLHGKLHIVEKAIKSNYNCIFIGDYIDDYTRSIEDQIETLRLVLDLAETNPEKYTALMGNHELSYLDREMRASGWNATTQIHVDHLSSRMRSILKPFIFINNYLISHAGVSQALLDNLGLTLKEYLDNKNYSQIGYARGGLSPVGGLYWCDWFREFDPIPNQSQIVGHSGYRPIGVSKGILEKEGNFNVDCYEHIEEYLLISEEQTEIITLK